MTEVDVVVVGAGLAGLRCATALRESGLDVLVLEAADAVGGRIRTDVVDGFRVDRGFQLLNPAYPAVRRWVDVAALDLQPFAAGVAARTDDGLAVLGHPLKQPSLLGPTLGSVVRAGGARPGEVAAVLRWARRLLVPRRSRTLTDVLAGGPDDTLRHALDDAHLDGLLRRVVERFYAGVLLEDDLDTANRYALLLAWMFVKAAPGLPRDGMRALPDQLARPLGDRVHTGAPVERVSGGDLSAEVWVAGDVVRAAAVVVATGAVEAAGLLGSDAVATKGVVTTWWAADTAPSRSALLHVDGRARPGGPVVNCAVVSNAAPSYAPPRRHLVQASALIGPGRAMPSEAEVRRHAGQVFGHDPSSWEVVARHEVWHALPAQPVPFSAGRPVSLGGRLFVCGDHVDTGSIQGALVSGQRAADAVRGLLV